MTTTETSTRTEPTVPIPVRLDIDTVAPRFSRRHRRPAA